MNRLVSGSPQCQKVRPQNSDRVGRPTFPHVYMGMHFSASDIPVLEGAPLDGEVTIKKMAPTDHGLFNDQFMVLARVASGGQTGALKPGV